MLGNRTCRPMVRETPALYRPIRPEQTIFYRLVRDHFDQFALVHEERFEAGGSSSSGSEGCWVFSRGGVKLRAGLG